jgi:uncharacterized protein YjbJ (UPF0337 family)
LTQPLRVSIVSQPVRLSAGAFCASGRKWQRNIANIPAGNARIKSRERRKSIRQSTRDKSKGKFHEGKGDIKEKVGRAANKPNREVKFQHERIGGKIYKKIGEGEEILGAESAWVRFCDLMGDAIPPALRTIHISRVKQR